MRAKTAQIEPICLFMVMIVVQLATTQLVNAQAHDEFDINEIPQPRDYFENDGQSYWRAPGDPPPLLDPPPLVDPPPAVESAPAVEIRRAQLEIRTRGPHLAYIDRHGVYEFDITNIGNAIAKDVAVKTTLPAGVALLAVDRRATYGDDRTTFSWKVAEIAPGATEVFRLKVHATAEGQQLFSIAASAQRSVSAAAEHVTGIISRADLRLIVQGTDGPTEVGGTANFSFSVSNKGSEKAENVTVVIRLGEDLEAIRPEEIIDSDGELTFAPFDLPASQQRQLSFQAIGWATGDHLVRVELRAAGDSRPIVLEERAFFYDSSLSQADGADPVR